MNSFAVNYSPFTKALRMLGMDSMTATTFWRCPLVSGTLGQCDTNLPEPDCNTVTVTGHQPIYYHINSDQFSKAGVHAAHWEWLVL